MVYLRPVLGLEEFRIIGWHDNWWHPARFPDNLLSNMAGNAFYAFAVVPILMTTFAGQGIIEEVVQQHHDAMIKDKAAEAEVAKVDTKKDSDSDTAAW